MENLQGKICRIFGTLVRSPVPLGKNGKIVFVSQDADGGRRKREVFGIGWENFQPAGSQDAQNMTVGDERDVS